MTQAEYIADLRSKLSRIKTVEKDLGKQVATIHARQTQDIFSEGRASKVSGKSYSKGYAKTRRKKGRQIAVVDLNFTAQLFKDYASSLTRLSPFVWVTGFKRTDSIGKFESNLTRYGKEVWMLPQGEIDKLTAEFGNIMVNYIV